MNKRICSYLAACGMVLSMLAGCGHKEEIPDNTDTSDVAVTDAVETGTSEDISVQSTENFEDTAFDITSEKELVDFIKGDWQITDIEGDNRDFGTLSINSSGGFVFKRKDADARLEGDISFLRHSIYSAETDSMVEDPEYTAFEMNVSSIPKEFALPDASYLPDEERTDGKFYIARGGSDDYLYLEWIGNGDSYLFEYVFQNGERIKKEFEEDGSCTHQTKWMFHRSNRQAKVSLSPKNDEFYGFIWNRTADGTLMIEPLKEHTSEAYEDYTNRHYLEGYFAPDGDIGLTGCKLSADADTSLVLDHAELDFVHPLDMYRIKTDSEGLISEISDVDKAYYGLYDMGSLEPEFSYEGITFTYNKVTYDLDDYDTLCNAIMDMWQVGDWIVIEGHINPHFGTYYLLNTFTGELDKHFDGANLIWQGDDITTAVYSCYEKVYNFKDHVIGACEDEVYELEFTGSGESVVATDFSDKKYTFETTTEDEAVYRLADYMRHPVASTWKEFVSEAPGDALALAIVNPPYDVANVLPYADSLNGESGECCYIVSLFDGAKCHLDTVDADVSGDTVKWTSTGTKDSFDLNRGRAKGYYSIIPEGIATQCIYISADGKGGIFPICTISGKNDICSTFVTASMSAAEAEKITESTGKDMMGSYADIINALKKAEDEHYDESQMMELDIDTGLVQHGYPYATENSEVRYLLYDVNKDGTEELIVTYYGFIVDIYGYDGKKAVNAYSCMYRSTAVLHEDGMIEDVSSISATDTSVTWLSFKPRIGQYLPICQMRSDPESGTHYYDYANEGEASDVVDFYLENGNIPVYAWEWFGELYEDEYNSLISKTPEVKLPEGTPVSNFAGF